MKVSEIVRRVREYLDEVSAVNDGVVLNGSTPIADRIIAIIPECAMLFMKGKAMDEAIVSSLEVDDRGVGYMLLPADFGSLEELRLSCWQRSVFSTIDAGSPLYSQQQHLVTRGGSVRPVVALVPYSTPSPTALPLSEQGESYAVTGNSGYRLELYSVPVWDRARVEVVRATYKPMIDATDMDAEVDIMPNREAALCYMIAVRVSRTYGNATAVEMLTASLNEELQKVVNG